MNSQRTELLEKYCVTVLQAQPAERGKWREKLLGLSTQYLHSAKPQQRLFEVTLETLSAIVSLRLPVDLSAARNFFLIFENYATNLIDCPWKREFRKITMYSGFYKTEIEPLVKDTSKLMAPIGYEQVGTCLELKKLPAANKLQDMAFEFFLASVECSILLEIFEKLSPFGFTVKEIYDCRRKTRGDSAELLKALSSIRSIGERMDEDNHLQFNGRGVDVTFKTHTRDFEEKVNLKPIDKPSNFEAGYGFAASAGKGHFEISQQQKESGILAEQHSDADNESCDKKTESIEAMLQAITPEMISDVNIRKQIVMKLNPLPRNESIHSSLPLLPNVTAKHVPAGGTRPHTEPLLIPGKESRDVYQGASGARTEPLVMPRQSSKAQGSDSKQKTWQCSRCSFVNNTDVKNRHQLCGSCNIQRRDA